MTQVTNEPHPELTALLQLAPCGVDSWRSVTADANAGGEVFGGQYLGLSLAAAMLSARGRHPHAMACFFLRSARASEPVEFRVERTRDGRAFAHRRVAAWQGGKEMFRAEISFHEWEAGQPSHARTGPWAAPLELLRSHRQCVLDRVHELDPLVVRRVVNRGRSRPIFSTRQSGSAPRPPSPRPSPGCARCRRRPRMTTSHSMRRWHI